MFIKFEKGLLKIANAFGKNKFLDSIRVSMIKVIPLWLIGSLFLLLANFPLSYVNELFLKYFGEYYNVWFLNLSAVSFYISGFVVCLVVTHTYCKKLKIRPYIGMGLSFFAYCIVFNSYLVEIYSKLMSGKVIVQSSYGSYLQYIGNLSVFYGLFCAFFSVVIYNYLYKRNIVDRLIEKSRDDIKKWLGIALYYILVLVPILFINYAMSFVSIFEFESFINVYISNSDLMVKDSMISNLVYLVLNQLFIFSSMTASLLNESFLLISSALSLENMLAYQSGYAITNIFTIDFIQFFIFFGGLGSTLSLVIVLIFFTKSYKLKKVGKLCAIPSMFGINAPLLLGLPLFLNPILLIPFMIVPVLNLILSYYAVAFQIIPQTFGMNVIWTTPIGISGLLTTNSINAILWQLFLVFIGCCIYYPFVKAFDKHFIIKDAMEVLEIDSFEIDRKIEKTSRNYFGFITTKFSRKDKKIMIADDLESSNEEVL